MGEPVVRDLREGRAGDDADVDLRSCGRQHVVGRLRRTVRVHEQRRSDRRVRPSRGPLGHEPARAAQRVLRSALRPVLRVHRGVGHGRSDRRVLPLSVPVRQVERLSEARRVARRVLHGDERVHGHHAGVRRPGRRRLRSRQHAERPAGPDDLHGSRVGGPQPRRHVARGSRWPPAAGRHAGLLRPDGRRRVRVLRRSTAALAIPRRLDEPRGINLHQSRGLAHAAVRLRHVQLLAHVHSAARDDREGRCARGSFDVPAAISQLRRPRVARRESHR